MEKKKISFQSLKGWLYLLPAILFLGFFMVYPLIDVFVYSFEEGYNSASQTYFGIGAIGPVDKINRASSKPGNDEIDQPIRIRSLLEQDGIGGYNYSYVLHDNYFLQAVKNTFLLVVITVPLSTGLALLISVGLSSIKPLRNLFP